MIGGLVVQVVLWTLAVALTIWILGPAVAFLLGARRIDVDVHPEPPLAKPYPEDSDGLRRYHQFIELGFRPVGWSAEHGRFLTPLHWRWRSVQGARWLVAPDDRTFVCLYRVVADEPVRFGAVTLLDGDGSWSTYYPGAGLQLEPVGNRGRAEVRGVEPAELLERHAEQVEVFRRERGLAIRSGTLAEVAAAGLAYTRAHMARSRTGAALLVLPLGLFALPASFSFTMLARGGDRAGVVGAGGVIFMALFYAAVRYGMLKLTTGHAARRTHTRAFDLEQTAVTTDGKIVPGRHERWVRGIAVLGAADMVARIAILGAKSLAIVRLGPGTIIVAGMLVFFSAFNLRELGGRALGRVTGPRQKSRSLQNLWFNWGAVAVMFNSDSKNGFTSPHLIWLGVAVALAIVAGWLEKKGRR